MNGKSEGTVQFVGLALCPILKLPIKRNGRLSRNEWPAYRRRSSAKISPLSLC